MYKIVIHYNIDGRATADILDKGGEGLTLEDALKVCSILFADAKNIISLEITLL